MKIPSSLFSFSRQEGDRRVKLQNMVKFPLTGLDMTPHVVKRSQSSWSLPSHWSPWRRPYGLGRDPEDCVYDLYAVCNHRGTMHGGHYTGPQRGRPGRARRPAACRACDRVVLPSTRACPRAEKRGFSLLRRSRPAVAGRPWARRADRSPARLAPSPAAAPLCFRRAPASPVFGVIVEHFVVSSQCLGRAFFSV